MHWQYTTCHHLLFFKQRSHPMIEKQSQSQRHKSGWWDPPCIRVSLNSFISSISLHWQDTCRFSKNKSSHDIAIKVDDKTHFSWPCREGPPHAVLFQFPFWPCLQLPCFSSSLSRVWLKMLFLSSSLSRAWFKTLCFFTSLSSARAKSCVFPVPFLFPSSLPVPFPVPFADSRFFSRKVVAIFLKKKQKCFVV